MRYLSYEEKRVIVQKALNREDQTIIQVASSLSIGLSTLERWMRQFKNGKLTDGSFVSLSKPDLIQSQKLEHLGLTANLDEVELGAYCREHGLYSFQIYEWKNEFMTEDNKSEKKEKNPSELKTLREENKHLKQELKRKEKALAEATALLVLKKKANALWGDLEDE